VAHQAHRRLAPSRSSRSATGSRPSATPASYGYWPGAANRLLQAWDKVFATVVDMGRRVERACTRPGLRLVRNVTRFLQLAAVAAGVTVALPTDAWGQASGDVQVLVTPATSATAASWTVAALGGRVQLVHDGTVQALVPRSALPQLRRSAAVASA